MWRIIDISADNYTLFCHQENLVVVKDKEEKLTAHFSDINCIIIHSYSIVLSGVVVQKLIEYNIPLIVCDKFHNPCGILLQTFKHTEYGNRIYLQINATKPMLKKAWKQIIEIKIKNQAKVLYEFKKFLEYKTLIDYSKNVKSGDSTNREAVASKIYFQTLFDNFRREPESSDIINASLNYGYAILRSNVARCVVGCGLNPAIGIFHSHKNNYFCLVDDLMEPLRPFIDKYIKDNFDIITKENFLSSEVKKIIAAILEYRFKYEEENLTLNTLIQRYVLSYIDYLSKMSKKINIPQL